LKYLWIGVAGAAGALSRYGLGLVVKGLAGPGFPAGTLLINVTGSLLIGLVAGLGSDRGPIPPAWRVPVATGFIGAYTTFSTWTVDSVQLLESGRGGAALTNVVVSVVAGAVAVWVGLLVSRLRTAESGGRQGR